MNMAKSHGITYDNCKDCESRCAHAGKNRSFVCIKGVSCKVKKEKPQTNADRIREMSDEELAELLLNGCTGGTLCEDQPQNEYGSVDCFACRMKWLRQPAEEE